MNEKSVKKLTRIAGLACNVAGIALLITGGSVNYKAQLVENLTSGGTTLHMQEQLNDEVVPMFKPVPEQLHGAATDLSAAVESSVLLILGMLLLLIGFGLHALFTMRDERQVHISTAKRNKQDDLQPRRRRYLEIYWLEK